MTLEGLSSVCAKLEPAGLKNNEILEINFLQKFTSHARCRMFSSVSSQKNLGWKVFLQAWNVEKNSCQIMASPTISYQL